MNSQKTKLDFHDLRVKSATITNINSRSEINPYYQHKDGRFFLPIFTAPMDTVVNYKNVGIFESNKIHAINPRGDKLPFWNLGAEFRFRAVSLDEFIDEFLKTNNGKKRNPIQNNAYILIDIANGHMKKLIDTAKTAKEIHGKKLTLMIGNIANPATYAIFAQVGVDFCRCGIGNGSACLTTKQTTIGYPMASLIQECREIKVAKNYSTKIVADGGMKDYSDIILALALGADYVMLGSVLNKSLESCADTYVFNRIKINQYSNFARWLLKNKFTISKKFRGMSTKEVQKKWGKVKIKTSEGISTKQKVEYTISKWVENLDDYLRTAMSYSNSKTLHDFIGKVETIEISDKAYDRFNK
ncbi:MAG: IMP dehydrogenase [Candidatus Izemoplasmatales bacterium]